MSLLNKFRKYAHKNIEEEIIEHISDLLNTKEEFGAYEKNLGLGSYFYASSNNQVIKHLMQDIKTCLEKFEKRVELVNIQTIPSSDCFSLAFLIQCKIKNSSVALQLSFQHQKNLFNVELKS